MVSALGSGASGQGFSHGQGHCCILGHACARHFTLTVPLSTKMYELVLTNG